MTAERAKDVLQEVSLSDEAMKDVVKRIHNKAVDLAFDDWKHEPIVSVGIVSGDEIRFQLNGTYTIGNKEVTGKQTVKFKDGQILWNSAVYQELCFTPQNDDISFTLEDVTIGSRLPLGAQRGTNLSSESYVLLSMEISSGLLMNYL